MVKAIIFVTNSNNSLTNGSARFMTNSNIVNKELNVLNISSYLDNGIDYLSYNSYGCMSKLSLFQVKNLGSSIHSIGKNCYFMN